MAKELETEKKSPDNAETKADKKSKDKKPAKKKKELLSISRTQKRNLKRLFGLLRKRPPEILSSCWLCA